MMSPQTHPAHIILGDSGRPWCHVREHFPDLRPFDVVIYPDVEKAPLLMDHVSAAVQSVAIYVSRFARTDKEKKSSKKKKTPIPAFCGHLILDFVQKHPAITRVLLLLDKECESRSFRFAKSVVKAFAKNTSSCNQKNLEVVVSSCPPQVGALAKFMETTAKIAQSLSESKSRSPVVISKLYLQDSEGIKDHKADPEDQKRLALAVARLRDPLSLTLEGRHSSIFIDILGQKPRKEESVSVVPLQKLYLNGETACHWAAIQRVLSSPNASKLESFKIQTNWDANNTHPKRIGKPKGYKTKPMVINKLKIDHNLQQNEQKLLAKSLSHPDSRVQAFTLRQGNPTIRLLEGLAQIGSLQELELQYHFGYLPFPYNQFFAPDHKAGESLAAVIHDNRNLKVLKLSLHVGQGYYSVANLFVREFVVGLRSHEELQTIHLEIHNKNHSAHNDCGEVNILPLILVLRGGFQDPNGAFSQRALSIPNVQHLHLAIPEPSKGTKGYLTRLLRDSLCTLESFELLAHEFAVGFDSSETPYPISRLIEASNISPWLKRFKLRGVRSQDFADIASLKNLLPQLAKLTELSIQLGDNNQALTSKKDVLEEIMEGMKLNTSLESFKLEPIGNRQQHACYDKLQSYCLRNKIIKMSLAFDKGGIPLALLPRALHKIQLEAQKLDGWSTDLVREPYQQLLSRILFTRIREPKKVNHQTTTSEIGGSKRKFEDQDEPGLESPSAKRPNNLVHAS